MRFYKWIVLGFLTVFAHAHALDQWLFLNAQGNVVESRNEAACVLDTYTSVLWELKSKQTTSTRYFEHRYSWFNPALDRKEQGVQNGPESDACTTGSFCNTHRYIQETNATALCGKSNWRLPSNQQLQTLRVDRAHDPIIDTRIFKNTALGSYWTQDGHPNTFGLAKDTPFVAGIVSGYTEKLYGLHVRLVSKF